MVLCTCQSCELHHITIYDRGRIITDITQSEFWKELDIHEIQHWLNYVLDVADVLENALDFLAHCKVKDGFLTYQYEFRPYPQMDRISSRVDQKSMTVFADDKEAATITI